MTGASRETNLAPSSPQKAPELAATLRYRNSAAPLRWNTMQLAVKAALGDASVFARTIRSPRERGRPFVSINTR